MHYIVLNYIQTLDYILPRYDHLVYVVRFHLTSNYECIEMQQRPAFQMSDEKVKDIKHTTPNISCIVTLPLVTWQDQT